MIIDASDKEVVNGCLILKNKLFDAANFKQKKFKYLFAESVTQIPAGCFINSKVESIFCPNVEEIQGDK
jgi:hypothetical protein